MTVAGDVQPLAKEPDEDEAFADNMALYWVDLDRSLAGVLAFGVWPNRGEHGKGITWFGLHDAANGVIVQHTRPPMDLADGDRTTTRLGAGGVHHEIDRDGSYRVVAVDEPTGAEVELRLHDFFPLTPHPVRGDDDPVLAALAARHQETAGRAEGVVRVDGRGIDVRALYVRDRSWGPRRDVPIATYHWSVGTCGSDLMWSAMSTTVPGMPVMKTGFAIIDGNVLSLTARSAFTLDEDSLTVLGWRTAGRLDDGRRFEVDAVAQTHLLDHRTWPPIVATDTLGRADVVVGGRSRPGVAALNMVVNPRLGAAAPVRYDGGSITEGRSTLPPDAAQ